LNLLYIIAKKGVLYDHNLIRTHSKSQTCFSFSFCLAKKKQKPKAKDQLPFFIAQKATAAPPKKL
jgi:hypothetical protein